MHKAGMMHVRATLRQSSDTSVYSSAQRDQQELLDWAIQHYTDDRNRLKKQERKEAVLRPLAVGEEALLARIRQRIDRCGYRLPGVRVSYHDVSVVRRAVPASAGHPTVLTPITSLFQRPSGHTVAALDGITGVLEPGSFTLLLGPPGSGKSTLLKLLSGRLAASRMVELRGADSIRYNGVQRDAFVLQRTAAYVDQVERLLPTLTCRETLNFSETCTGERESMSAAVRTMMSWEAAHPELADRIPLDDEVDEMLLRMMRAHNLMQTEYALAILGLMHVGDTLVGDATLRGVSGGEKRRVGLGEGIVTSTMVLLLDEASTGLDSASTLALTRSMRRWAKLLNTTIVMALLQPEPAVVAEFEDVLLLSEGKVIWHGPMDAALEHFASCGLHPLPGQEAAEFLSQVALPVDQDPLLAQGGSPLSADQLGQRFWSSSQGLRLADAARTVQTPDAADVSGLDQRKHAAPWPVLLRVCTSRMFKVEFARNWEACAIRWCLALFIGLVTGVLFLQLPTTFPGGLSALGLLNSALFFVQLLSIPTIQLTYDKRPILFRQRDDLVYPAWVEWLPNTLLNLPVLVVDALIYGVPLYWLVGFSATPSAFFTFLLVLLCFSLLCDNLYRVYGAATQALTLALGVGVCHGIINEILAGFIMTPGQIPVYWLWAYYINPLAYAFRAMAINEFSSPQWQQLPGVAASGAPTTLGNAVLDMFQIDTGSSMWVWAGVGVLLAMTAACAFFALIAYQYGRMPEGYAITADEDPPADALAAAVKSADAPSSLASTMLPEDAVSVNLRNASRGDQKHSEAAADVAGVTIAFSNLSYFVPHPGGGKAQLQLLHDISGVFKPGQLCALMGSSGAGKTTLMDVIAGRKTLGRISGNITVDGHPLASTSFSRISGYVEQMDVHTPLTTVREALLFSATLRAPRGTDVVDVVDRVLDMVDLTPLAGRLVGSPGIDGLSTEARKRLTIAVELVALPLVLFLDEPTSGLDTRAAVIIANVMRDICRRGVTVVATIHQPSAAIFSMFDDLMLLKRGGFLVYAGPLGPNCSTLINYFSAVPGTPPLREGINPSAWMLEVVGGAAALSDEDYPDLVKVYADSSLAKAAAAEIRTLCKEDHADYYCKEEQPAKQDDDDDGGGGVNDGDNDKGVKRSPTTTTTAVQSSVVPLPAVADDDHVKPPAPNTAPTRPQPAEQHLNPVAPAGALRQLYMLIWRARISYWRNPAANFNRFVITLLIALIIGSIEWGKGDVSRITSARDVQNTLGGLYMLASALAIEVGFESISHMAEDRTVYGRERGAGIYGAGPYILAQALVEVMYVTVQAVLYTVIAYFMMQAPVDAESFFYVLALVWLCAVVTFLMSQALVHTSRIAFIATTAYSVISNLQGLTSGFSRPLPTTPRAWWGAFMLNPQFYSFIGIGSELLGHVETVIADPSGAQVSVRDYVADLYRMRFDTFPGPYGALGMLAALGAAFLLISFCSMRFGAATRR